MSGTNAVENRSWWMARLFGRRTHRRSMTSSGIMAMGAQQKSSVVPSFQRENLTLSHAAGFIDLVRIPMCLLDMEGLTICCNHTFKSVFFQHEDNPLVSLTSIIHAEEMDRFNTAFESFRDDCGLELHGTYLTTVFKNGKAVTNRFEWSITRDPDQMYYIVSARPATISERNQASVANPTSSLASTSLASSNMSYLSGGGQNSMQQSWKSFTKTFVAVKEGYSKFHEMSETLETKRIFVRHVSHEIRTPLNVVMSGLDLLAAQRQAISKDMMEIILDIKSASAVAVDILNDLLTYEKLDSNMLKLDTCPCDVVDIIRRVFKMFQIQARYSDIDLRLDNQCGSETVIVEGDSTKLSQVFRNLVSNAMKFTSKGGLVVIVVKIQSETKQVRVEVQDTGAGMTVAERELLFHEVVQFHAKELQGGQGSGLGLFLSRRIVEMHGGAIGVDLEWAGVGSRFFIELPITSRLESNKVARRLSRMYSEDKLFTPPTRRRGRPRLLVVDDAALCRKFHCRLLDTYTCDTVEASDGREAVDMVKQSIREGHPFDGILMDANMPHMNGLHASQELRQLGYHGKIFGITGNGFQTDIDDFIAYGASEVLVKPLSLDKYAYIVQSVDGTSLGVSPASQLKEITETGSSFDFPASP